MMSSLLEFKARVGAHVRVVLPSPSALLFSSIAHALIPQSSNMSKSSVTAEGLPPHDSHRNRPSGSKYLRTINSIDDACASPLGNSLIVAFITV
jgi:hypothetical protein